MNIWRGQIEGADALEDFDPYRKWLGIPPAEQPPDHYRLLGVTRFEDDPDTIANAADRQMGHVRTFQTGTHSAVSQQLLNEISVARICLLDATKKAEYDNQLRAKDARQTQPTAETSSSLQPAPRPIAAMSPLPPAARVVPTVTARSQPPGAAPQTPAPQPQWPQTAPPAADSTPVRVAPAARRRRPRIATLRSSTSEQSEAHKTVLIAAALAAFALAVFVVYKTRSGPGGEVTDGQAASANQLAQDDADKAREIAESQAASAGDAIVPRPVVMASEDPLTDIPRPEQPPPEQPPSPASAGSVSSDAAAVAEPVAPAAAKLLTSAVAWYRAEGNANDSAGKHHGKLQDGARIVKIEKGHAFELDGEHGNVVIPESPQLNATGQITMMAWIRAEPTWGQVVTAATDASGGQRTGFYLCISPYGHLCARFNAPGEPWDAHQAWGRESVYFGRWVHVAATYDGRMLTVYANGVTVLAEEVGRKPVDLTGARLIIGGLNAPGFARFKGMIDEVVVFDRGLSQAEIGTIFRATSVGKDGGNDMPRDKVAPSEELTPKQQSLVKGYANAGTMDVLARIDLARDALDGKWTQDADGLHSPRDSQYATLRLPVAVPEEYCLTVVAERADGWKGLMPALVAGLVGEKTTQFNAIIDWKESTGLSRVDDRSAIENESTVSGRNLFDEGRPSVVTYIVRKGAVEIEFDGRRILAWRGDFSRLRTDLAWRKHFTSPLRLFLSTHCEYLFKAIYLTPLADAGILPDISNAAPIDLFKTIDLKRHAVRGGWSFEGPVLVSPAKVHDAMLRVPGALPNEYVLRIVTELPRDHEGSREFAIGLVTPPSQVHVVLDAGNRSGFEGIEGKPRYADETTFNGQLFIPGIESTIDCVVRKESIRIDFDGRTIIDSKGDPRKLTSVGPKAGVPKRNLYFGTHQRFLIKKAELLPLAQVARPDAGWPVPTKTVDVLKLVAPLRDAVRGEWTLDRGALISPLDERLACINLPSGVPDEYSLTVEANRMGGGQASALYLGLKSGSSQCLMIVDANGTSRLELVDGRRFDGNETTTEELRLRGGATAHIECTIRKTGIRVTFNGKTVVDWHGERERLSVLPLWPGRAVPGLFLSTRGSYRFSRIEVKPLAPE